MTSLSEAIADLLVHYTEAAHAAHARNLSRRDTTRAAGEAVAYGTLTELLKKPNIASAAALRVLASDLRAEAARDTIRADQNRTNRARWRGYARVWTEAAATLDALATDSESHLLASTTYD